MIYEKVLIKSLFVFSNCIEIFFTSTGSCIKYAWLENTDKHYPNVFKVCINDKQKKLLISENTLLRISAVESDINIKLCLSDDVDKISYEFCKNFSIIGQGNLKYNFKILCKNDLIILKFISKFDKSIVPAKKSNARWAESALNIFLGNRNSVNMKFCKTEYKCVPLDIIVIGSCFTRSVFKSDSYFNPNYKNFFHVCFTAFHNSLISLMSDPIVDKSYLEIADLKRREVFKYINIEFEKNLFELIDTFTPKYIVMDNYIDANRPLIKISENQYLTYNSYLSNSIYKRTFEDCVAISPNSLEYKKLYKKAAKKFSYELSKRGLDKKIILIGGRLSEYKENKSTDKVELWDNLDYWVRPSNQNWNIVDKIFLEEIPVATYVDMRNSKWISSMNPPIRGGASPSHYQTGYYRDILEKIKNAVFTEV